MTAPDLARFRRAQAPEPEPAPGALSFATREAQNQRQLDVRHGDGEAAAALTRLACGRGDFEAARASYVRASRVDRAVLRDEIEARFGPDVSRDLEEPAPTFAERSPWRESFVFPFLGTGPGILAGGTVGFVLLTTFVPIFGFLLAAGALALHHTTVLRSTVGGSDDPPEQADFPTFGMGVLLIPLGFAFVFTPWVIVASSCVGGEATEAMNRLILVVKAFVALAAVFVLLVPIIPIAEAAYAAHGSIEALSPGVWLGAMTSNPAAALSVGYFCTFSVLAGAALLVLAGNAPWIVALFAALAAQSILTIAARRLGLFARAAWPVA